MRIVSELSIFLLMHAYCLLIQSQDSGLTTGEEPSDIFCGTSSVRPCLPFFYQADGQTELKTLKSDRQELASLNVTEAHYSKYVVALRIEKASVDSFIKNGLKSPRESVLDTYVINNVDNIKMAPYYFFKSNIKDGSYKVTNKQFKALCGLDRLIIGIGNANVECLSVEDIKCDQKLDGWFAQCCKWKDRIKMGSGHTILAIACMPAMKAMAMIVKHDLERGKSKYMLEQYYDDFNSSGSVTELPSTEDDILASLVQQGLSDALLTRKAIALIGKQGDVLIHGIPKMATLPGTQSYNRLTNVKKVVVTTAGFAVLFESASVISWGLFSSTAVPAELQDTNFANIFANPLGECFVALRSNGTLIQWGATINCTSSNRRRTSNNDDLISFSSVKDKLRNVIDVITTKGAFLAVTTDGTGITWGAIAEGAGGLPEHTTGYFKSSGDKAIDIAATHDAFGAILRNGDTLFWKNRLYAEIADGKNDEGFQLTSGVYQLIPSGQTFMARKDDGNVVSVALDDAKATLTAQLFGKDALHSARLYSFLIGDITALPSTDGFLVRLTTGCNYSSWERHNNECESQHFEEGRHLQTAPFNTMCNATVQYVPCTTPSPPPSTTLSPAPKSPWTPTNIALISVFTVLGAGLALGIASYLRGRFLNRAVID